MFIILLVGNFPPFGYAGSGDDQGGGGEGETQSTKTVNFSYGDNGTTKSIGSSINYSTYLTEALNLNTTTSLSNSYNKETDFPAKSINFSTALNYVPQGSRLNTMVNYSYSKTDSSVTPQGSSEAFKVYDRNTCLNSSVGYRFTDNLKLSMDMAFTHHFRDNSAPRASRDNLDKESKSVGSTMTYNITQTTNMSGSYSYSKQTGWQLWKNGDCEMFDPPKIYENSDGGNLSGGLQSSIDVSENFHISTSVNAFDYRKLDAYNPANNAKQLSGSGSASVSYTPYTNIKFLGDASFNRSQTLYDKEAAKILGHSVFNIYETKLDLGGKLEWQISPNARFTTDFTRSYDDKDFADQQGNHPGEYDQDAQNYKTIYEVGLNSALIYTFSDRLSIQINHYYKNAKAQCKVLIGGVDNSQSIHNNNFHSSIRYELSDSTTSLVECGMDDTKNVYFDESRSGQNDHAANIDLIVEFLQDLGKYTHLDLKYDIYQRRTRLIKSGDITDDSLTRELVANLSFLLGIIQPTMGTGMQWIRNNQSAYDDVQTFILSPSVSFKPTDKFSVDFYFTYTRYHNASTTNPDRLKIESKVNYRSSISYQLFSGLNLNLSMDREPTANNSTFSGGLNYSF
jgi:hypothetical protein